jgi:hypothetical protein
MNNNIKKYLIYIRYSLPVLSLLAILGMLFVPSYRFIFSGKAGERVSAANLLLNSWDKVRDALFGNLEQTNATITFSKIIFALIIVFVILFLLSIAISIWSAIIAFRCFLSDNEESAEYDRRIFCVFIPNRIALTALTSIGGVIALFPYLMPWLYGILSENISFVLEAPDALTVGGALILTVIVLSFVCARFERAFDADIFEKTKKNEPVGENSVSDDNDKGVETNIDRESRAHIRSLFDKDGDDKK